MAGAGSVQHAMKDDAQALQTLQSMPPSSYQMAMRDPGFQTTVASIYQAQNRLDVAQDILEKSVSTQMTAGQKPSTAVLLQLAGIYLSRNNAQAAYPDLPQDTDRRSRSGRCVEGACHDSARHGPRSGGAGAGAADSSCGAAAA